MAPTAIKHSKRGSPRPNDVAFCFNRLRISVGTVADVLSPARSAPLRGNGTVLVHSSCALLGAFFATSAASACLPGGRLLSTERQPVERSWAGLGISSSQEPVATFVSEARVMQHSGCVTELSNSIPEATYEHSFTRAFDVFYQPHEGGAPRVSAWAAAPACAAVTGSFAGG